MLTREVEFRYVDICCEGAMYKIKFIPDFQSEKGFAVISGNFGKEPRKKELW